jgi:hypothetical protein
MTGVCQQAQLFKKVFKLKLGHLSRCQWLTPVIPATQEAEIRKSVVWSQPRQIVCQTLSQKNLSCTKKGRSAGGVAQGVDPEFKSQVWKKIRPFGWANLIDFLIRRGHLNTRSMERKKHVRTQKMMTFCKSRKKLQQKQALLPPSSWISVSSTAKKMELHYRWNDWCECRRQVQGSCSSHFYKLADPYLCRRDWLLST